MLSVEAQKIKLRTMVQLTKSFSLLELIASETASRKGISNVPTDEVKQNLLTLCTKVLQPLRDWYDKPIVINSGYRSPQLNKAIGGSTTSQHCKGEAADIAVKDWKLVFNHIKDHMEFDQLIWEMGDENAPQWIHVSYTKGNNRKQVLRAKKNLIGKTVYSPCNE